VGEEERRPFGNRGHLIAKEGRDHSCWAKATVTTHESALGCKEKSDYECLRKVHHESLHRAHGLRRTCAHDTVTDMDYSHLNGKTIFYAAPANTHEDGRPTFHHAEKYGRLEVSGNVVVLEPVLFCLNLAITSGEISIHQPESSSP
jgi:hypothetical protein